MIFWIAIIATIVLILPILIDTYPWFFSHKITPSNDKLIELAKKSPPPQKWFSNKFDEDLFSISNPYRCHIALIPEKEGGYSAVVLNLPGAGSQGETKEEAITNVKEALVAVLELYLEDNRGIPWRDPESYKDKIPKNAELIWIIVEV